MIQFKILVLSLFSLVAFATDASEEFVACKKAQDCIVTQADFCGCGGMGTNTAINKVKVKEWIKKLEKEGQNSGCLAAMSDHWTCTKKVKTDCLKNRCIISEAK